MKIWEFKIDNEILISKEKNKYNIFNFIECVYEIEENKLGKTIKLLRDNNEIRNKSILYLNYKKINNYD